MIGTNSATSGTVRERLFLRVSSKSESQELPPNLLYERCWGSVCRIH